MARQYIRDDVTGEHEDLDQRAEIVWELDDGTTIKARLRDDGVQLREITWRKLELSLESSNTVVVHG